MAVELHFQKRFAVFPSPAGITKLFPARDSLVSDIPAGDGKIAKLFFHVVSSINYQSKGSLFELEFN